MNKVFVSDFKQRHSQAIISALRKEGFQIVSFSNNIDINKRKFGLDEIFRFQFESNNKQYLLEKLSQFQCDLVIPITIKSFEFFSKNKDYFLSNGLKLLVPDFEKWVMFYNKYATHSFVEPLGIPLPRTIPLGMKKFENDIEKSELKYPLVIKSTKEGGGRFVKYARNIEEVNNIIQEFLSVDSKMYENGGIIAQNYIQGKGCGYFALADKGKILSRFAHLRVRENPPSGGVSTACESFSHPKLFKYGDMIVEKSQYSGVIMIEFKYNELNDEFTLIEINPKFWGSTLLSIVSGVNFPVNYTKYLNNESFEIESYKSKIRLQFVLSDLSRVIKFKKGLLEFFIDFFNRKVIKDYSYFGFWYYLKYNLAKK